jgi:hypothetical protein
MQRSYTLLVAVILALMSQEVRAQFDDDFFSNNPNDPLQSFGLSEPEDPRVLLDRPPDAGAPGLADQPPSARTYSAFPVDFQFRGTAILDTMHNTGFIDDTPKYFPSQIALRGSPEALQRGRFEMSGESSEVMLNFAAPTLSQGARAQVTTRFTDTTPELRIAAGQVDVTTNTQLTGGITWTTFGHEKARPMSIINDGTPTGAVFRRQAQARFVMSNSNGFRFATAIENPISNDYVLPAAAVALPRWPDFVSRVRWRDPHNKVNDVQLAVLVRGMGFRDAADVEQFATGWGLAGSAQLQVFEEDRVHFGVVGGEGLGRYLFGLGVSDNDVTAAGLNAAGTFTPVPHIGAYFGYRHIWSPCLMSNVGYGYAHADLIAGLPANVTRKTQNAWTNMVLAVTDQFFVGVEYHYGMTENNSGLDGDNHRIQVTLSYHAKSS